MVNASMNEYEALAHAFLRSMAEKKRLPPHGDEVSASMRGEMAVLRQLGESAEQMTAGDLSRELRMTTSRIAAVLNSLQKKGLIERGGDAQDRRRVLVRLTDEGRALCEHRKACVRRRLAAIFAQLGMEDTRSFVRIMGRVFEINEALGAREDSPAGARRM